MMFDNHEAVWDDGGRRKYGVVRSYKESNEFVRVWQIVRNIHPEGRGSL